MRALQDIISQQLRANSILGAGGGLGGLLGGVLGPVLKLFGGGGFTDTGLAVPIPLAHGGPLGAGRAALVGERGPELFVPRTAGTIIPNSGLGGEGGITNNYTINADMRGASFEAVVRLERFVRRLDATFNSRALGVVVDARRRNPRLFS